MTGLPDRPWDDPELTGWHRLPMHAVRHGPGGTGQWLPLDGRWRFQLLPWPDDPPGTDWTEIAVPGCWTMQQFDDRYGVADRPQYTNVQMPWPDLPPHPPEANPTGVYERDIEVPAGWRGRRVVLHVGAAESVLLARLNGVDVGVGKDSHLASEFDVTRAVRPGEANRLRLTVVKWSDASFIEDQDQWWHGGITRSVFLYATARRYLADVRIRAGLARLPGSAAAGRPRYLAADGTATGELRVDVEVGSLDGGVPPGWTVSAGVEGLAGPEGLAGLEPALGTAEPRFGPVDLPGAPDDEEWPPGIGLVRLRGSFPRVVPWSAELPQRYRLIVRLQDAGRNTVDETVIGVGFRQVEIVGRDLLVNGERVLFRGVNRHDFHPETGRVVTVDDVRADLCLIRRFGFNAVRTSHYPNDPVLLDLADELGVYVVDEADLECHAYAHHLADDPRYLAAFVDRVSRMVRRDLNHPSVLVWSLGNESGYGAGHDAAAGWLRRYDPTRPVQYEAAIRDAWQTVTPASDVVCPMYPSIEDIVAHARSERATGPLIMCEYSHAMGNSNGTLAEYWQAIETTPGLQGGFIWELWDHGLLQPASPQPVLSKPALQPQLPGAAPPGYRWAYGGDFGDVPNDGSFCADGLAFPDRVPKPAMFEHRALACPVAMEAADTPAPAVLTLRNRQHFRDLSWLRGTWSLTTDPRTTAATATARPAEHRVAAELPRIPPGGSARLVVPAAVCDGLPAAGESWLALEVETAVPLPWAPAGTPVGSLCLQLRRDGRGVLERAGASRPGARPPALDQDGRLAHPMLSSPPQLALWRAPTQNDRHGGVARRWSQWGLDRLERQVVRIARDPHDPRVVVTSRYLTGGGAQVEHEQALTSFVTASGRLGVLVEETAVIPEQLQDLPRVGTGFETITGLDTLEWFGPGPVETYPDRCAGAPVGHHEIEVDRAYTPYLRPQESGGRHGVRWFAVRGRDQGLLVHLERPSQVSVTRYRAGELSAAGHHDELVARPQAIVHLDAAHRGLGTASCGPDTLPGYLLGPGVYRWAWTLLTPP